MQESRTAPTKGHLAKCRVASSATESMEVLLLGLPQGEAQHLLERETVGKVGLLDAAIEGSF